MNYKGSYPAPKYQHGLQTVCGTIQRREYNNVWEGWEYVTTEGLRLAEEEVDRWIKGKKKSIKSY